MIISMTGYSNYKCENNKISFSMELKSVNSKYFESTIKVPKLFSDQENKIMNIIKGNLIRGRVTFNLSYNLKEHKSNVFKLDKAELIKHFNILSEIKKSTKIKEDIRLSDIMSFQDSIISNTSLNDKETLKLLYSGLKKIIDNHSKFRKKEGKVIRKDILDSLKIINKNILKIEKKWNIEKKVYADKFKNKISKVIDNYNLNNNRLYQEVAFILDKRDINEEIVRFKSHIEFFISYIKEYDLLGKRFLFLIQELFREINTIASKSELIDINQLVIEIKTELEKIKEQVYNIL
ncbi:MAG: YicC family protein [Candidatus Marinimicrobia bacterium]|nr:YicC family protein [Candidatus Neomarinimicrobiota bacterium]